MRRSDHPSRPKAMTCCFFSSFKTLLTSTEGIALASTQRPECWLIVGRFSGDYAWPVLGDHRGSGNRIGGDGSLNRPKPARNDPNCCSTKAEYETLKSQEN